jgi:hypothetical protein
MGQNLNRASKRGLFDELPDQCKPGPVLARCGALLCLNCRIRLSRKRQHNVGALGSNILVPFGRDPQTLLIRGTSFLNDGIHCSPFANPVAAQLMHRRTLSRTPRITFPAVHLKTLA